MGVACVIRKLSLGDFVWVAKEKVCVQQNQLMLPKRCVFMPTCFFVSISGSFML